MQREDTKNVDYICINKEIYIVIKAEEKRMGIDVFKLFNCHFVYLYMFVYACVCICLCKLLGDTQLC